jgi:hypothetical protein
MIVLLRREGILSAKRNRTHGPVMGILTSKIRLRWKGHLRFLCRFHPEAAFFEK